MFIVSLHSNVFIFTELFNTLFLKRYTSVAFHLSAQNNTKSLACAALAAVLGCQGDDVAVADQEDGLGWRDV